MYNDVRNILFSLSGKAMNIRNTVRTAPHTTLSIHMHPRRGFITKYYKKSVKAIIENGGENSH